MNPYTLLYNARTRVYSLNGQDERDLSLSLTRTGYLLLKGCTEYAYLKMPILKGPVRTPVRAYTPCTEGEPNCTHRDCEKECHG